MSIARKLGYTNSCPRKPLKRYHLSAVTKPGIKSPKLVCRFVAIKDAIEDRPLVDHDSDALRLSRLV